MLTIVASVNSSDNAIIAFEGGRPVDQLGHDTWSCRCLEETEDDGEDWSNWTQRWLRDISWQSPLGSEGQSAVSLEVHTAHPAGSMVGQERLVLPPMVGGGGQPRVNAIVCYRRSSTGRPCRAVRHSSSASRSRRRVRPPWSYFWLTSPWRGSPTPRRGPGPRWRTPLSHFPGLLCSPPGWPALSHT